MKKRILSIMMVLVMCLTLVPMTAFAADETNLKKEFFNNGNLTKPNAPYVQVIENENSNSEIYMYFDQTPEFLKFAEAVSTYESTNDRGYPFINYNEKGFQIDYKFNNGKWASETADWDNFEYGETDGYPAFECRFIVHEGNGDKMVQYTQCDLYGYNKDEGTPSFLTPYINVNETEDSIYQKFDYSNLTITYRVRTYFSYNQQDEDGEVIEEGIKLFSPWSDEVSIGKNGTQKELIAPTSLEAPVLSQFELATNDEGNTEAKYYIDFPQSVNDAIKYHELNDHFEPYYIQAQLKKNGGEWVDVYTANPTNLTNGYRSTGTGDNGGINPGDNVQIRVIIKTEYPEGNSPWSNIIGSVSSYQASTWATEGLQQADEMGLIPEVLKGSDLTKPITREEFAAVAVKAYEAFAGTSALPSDVNPFTDTKNTEVLKAYNLGITSGTSATTFAPNMLLNREQAATMLTNTFKKATIEGWTSQTNGNFKLEYEKPTPFADDAKISEWAKDSVYFMVANNIISGVGNNTFAPKNVTTEEQAIGYANATREQALIIASKMVKNLR